MKNLKNKLKGIGIGLGLLGSVFAGNINKSYADNDLPSYMYVKSTSASAIDPDVSLYHWTGGQEGIDSIDNKYPETLYSPPVIDFYSVADGWAFPDGETRMDREARPVESTTPFHLELHGRGLSNPVSTDLSFDIPDSFYGLPVWAYVTKADGTPVGNPINVVEADANNTSYTLDNITEGHMYNVDIKFENPPAPSPIPTVSEYGMMGLAGLLGLAGYGIMRKRFREDEGKAKVRVKK